MRRSRLNLASNKVLEDLQATLHRDHDYSYYFNFDQDAPKEPNASYEPLKSHRSNISSRYDKPETSRSKEKLNDQERVQIVRSRMKKFSCSSNLQLDPKDEKVRLSFKSSYYSLLSKSKFTISMQPFEDEIRDWLIDIIQITTSIGFNHLRKGTLSQKETKNFVSKNILQNIKEMLQDHKEIPLQKRFQLTKFINSELYYILEHIAGKYPQTVSKGVSKRIKSKVQTINNRESDEYDFLLRNNIHIKYRENGDYSSDIMRIINKLVSFSTDPFSQQIDLEQSNYEVFSEMMELIFDSVNSQQADIIASKVTKRIGQKALNKKQEDSFDNDQMKMDSQNKLSDSKRFVAGKQSHKIVQIGHKIPSSALLFTEEEIQSSKFKIYDSSILRLLTKWAEQLRNKIINPEQTFLTRIFKFKNSRGRLINLEPAMKDHLYRAAIKQIQNIEHYLEYLKEENFYLQTVFAQQKNKGKYSKNDTNVNIFAAKLNEIASQYVFKYINRLIHSLLTIPLAAAERAQSDREKAVLQSVDLVTFKIGDLMRCKCACSEQEFINILKVTDILHLQSAEVLKIVRIKNRLQTPNNDILINFLFGGKVQCQMQLSVLSPEGKDQSNSSKFSHLIYQIMRAELGPISEMASIVVQYDPLAYIYSKQKTYGPKLITAKNDAEKNMKKSEKILEICSFLQCRRLGKDIELPFICCTCQRLAIVHNPHFYYRDLSKLHRQCNDCLSNSYYVCEDQNKLREHVLNQNFENENDKIFCRNHLKLWNKQEFLKELKQETQDSISAKWFPSTGFMFKHDQKSPKLQYFTSMYEPLNSYMIFAKKNERGQSQLLSAIKIHEEKSKKIEIITREIQKFILVQFFNTKEETDQNGVRYLACDKSGCCGTRMNPGPVLERKEMEEYTREQIIKKSIEQQKSLLYLNHMPNSLSILQKQMSSFGNQNKVQKIKKTIQSIQAFQCQLQGIEMIGSFSNLTDLNIGNNPGVKFLRGLQNCLNLKYLNCSDCDLSCIEELKDLLRLQTINLSDNSRIDSIQALQNHSQLLDLFIRNTSIKSLSPLSNCLKLESLDLQGCINITSMSDVRSAHLSYISIISRLFGDIRIRSVFSCSQKFKDDLAVQKLNVVFVGQSHWRAFSEYQSSQQQKKFLVSDQWANDRQNKQGFEGAQNGKFYTTFEVNKL